MTDTSQHAEYCDKNHKSGQYLCSEERKWREKEKQEKLDCPFCNPNTAYGASPEFFDQWKIKHDYHKPVNAVVTPHPHGSE